MLCVVYHILFFLQWSFGVLQWEPLTRGCVPYPDLDAFDVKAYLRQGNRMHRPDFASEEMLVKIVSFLVDDLIDNKNLSQI